MAGGDGAVGDHRGGDRTARHRLGDFRAKGKGRGHDLLARRHLRIHGRGAVVHGDAEVAHAAGEGVGDRGDAGGVGLAAHARTGPDQDAELAPRNRDRLLLRIEPVRRGRGGGAVPDPEGDRALGGDPIAGGIDHFAAVADERGHLRLRPQGRGGNRERKSEGEEGAFHRERGGRGGTVRSGHGREGGREGLIDHQFANFIESAELKRARNRQGLAVQPGNRLGITAGHQTGPQQRRLGIV